MKTAIHIQPPFLRPEVDRQGKLRDNGTQSQDLQNKVGRPRPDARFRRRRLLGPLVIHLILVCLLATFGRSCRAVGRKRHQDAAAAAPQARPQPAERPAVRRGGYRSASRGVRRACVLTHPLPVLYFCFHRGGTSHQTVHSRVHPHGPAAAARPGGHIQGLVTHSSRAGAAFSLFFGDVGHGSASL